MAKKKDILPSTKKSGKYPFGLAQDKLLQHRFKIEVENIGFESHQFSI
jgi:hypothetical protein